MIGSAKKAKKKMAKYERMKKLGMPMASIINRMRMDQIPHDEIEAWSGESTNGNRATAAEDPAFEIPSSRVKLKPFHWGKMTSRQVNDTVWANSSDFGRFDINYSQIDELFQVVERSSGAATQKPTKTKDTSVIDPRRVQNVLIGLSRMGLSHDEVRDAIIQLDNEKLPPEKVQQILPYVPTDTELDMVRDYVTNGGDVGELTDAEHFFVTLMDLVAIPQRLKLWLFTNQFPAIVDNVLERIKTVQDMITRIEECTRLKTVFAIILNVGNYLNQGSSRGNAWGFRLQPTLALLDGMKGGDKKTSLMQFIVHTVYDVAPDAANFVTDLELLPRAMKINSGAIQKDLDEINRDMDTISKQVKAHRRTMSRTHSNWARSVVVPLAVFAGHMRDMSRAPKAMMRQEMARYETLKKPLNMDDIKDDTLPEDMFVKMMLQFHKQGNSRYREARNAFQETERKAQELATKFGCEEDLRWEQLFEKFNRFRTSFIKAQKELESQLKKAERQQQRAQRASELENRLQNRAAPENIPHENSQASQQANQKTERMMQLYAKHKTGHSQAQNDNDTGSRIVEV